MITIIQDGGLPIWFSIVFGLIALGDAILIARRADARKMAFLKAMTMVLVFAMVGGFCAGVSRSVAGCRGLPPARQADCPRYVLKGAGESLAGVTMGSAFLTLAWFIAAIGVRRRPADEPTGL
jgi:hypothetical protein